MEINKDSVKSPYDLREMLWYVIPGATLLLTIFLFDYWIAAQIRNVDVYNIDTIKIDEKIKVDTSLYFSGLEINSFLNDSSKNRDTNVSSIQQKKLHVKDSINRQNKLDSLRDSILYLKGQLFKKIHTPIFTVLRLTYIGEKMSGNNWIVSSVYLLLILTICYILGHLTYIIGTFLFERGLVMKGYSYPHIRLLGLVDHNGRRLDSLDAIADQRFNRALYFWSGFFFISFYVLYKIWGSDAPDSYKFLIVLVYILFFAFPIRFKFILDNITDWRNNDKLDDEYLIKSNSIKKLMLNIIDENLTKYKKKLRDQRRFASFAFFIRRFLKRRPEFGGYLFWLICSFVLLCLMSLIKFNYEYIPGFIFVKTHNILSIPLFIKELIILVGLFVILEMLFRWSVTQRYYATFLAIKAITSDNRYGNIDYKKRSRFVREQIIFEILFIKLYSFFSNEIDKFSKGHFHTQGKFDDAFMKKYKMAFLKVYKSKFINLNSHNYWLAKLYVMENSTFLNQQITFWENTYRFIKSIAASFLLATLFCSISFVTQYPTIMSVLKTYDNQHPVIKQFIELMKNSIDVLFIIPIVYFVLTILITQYYLYVFDNRYHRIVLRSFVSLALSKKYPTNN